ncbi:hypothetical protein GUJ93_ZPchr0007g6370 [Zizania palustris]|uniref:Uncharacterized protein n=1 Tax=Zizania palustris TaxID=103762 RepID=A0A8J5T2W6_ZIZPA|nr:hypothetical protein GUJ93_ZPchr0007g6370 [Zizania palustris]
MEVQSAPVAAKRMWGYLRAVFFMIRKGVVSKRRLLLSMQLVMRLKRRNRAVARSVANMLSHHHHGGGGGGNVLRRREYEFSCSNSTDVPAGAFSYGGGGGSASSARLAYFPCLGAEEVEEPHLDAETAALQRIEYYVAVSKAPSSPGLLLQEEECTPAPASPLLSTAGGFSVRVSNYSSEDDDDGDYDRGGGTAVDDEAEEFIRRFYEQLRRQNQGHGKRHANKIKIARLIKPIPFLPPPSVGTALGGGGDRFSDSLEVPAQRGIPVPIGASQE